jgi:hypothetical protein
MSKAEGAPPARRLLSKVKEREGEGAALGARQELTT